MEGGHRGAADRPSWRPTCAPTAAPPTTRAPTASSSSPALFARPPRTAGAGARLSTGRRTGLTARRRRRQRGRQRGRQRWPTSLTLCPSLGRQTLYHASRLCRRGGLTPRLGSCRSKCTTPGAPRRLSGSRPCTKRLPGIRAKTTRCSPRCRAECFTFTGFFGSK